jgi:hypothetical protein
MNRIILLSLAIMVSSPWVSEVSAATKYASSCSAADVQSAINSASNGDTVVVPAGNATWSSVVKIGTKAITLQGAGVGSTNITHNVSGSQVRLVQFTQHPTISTRITGFSFSGGSYDHRFIECSGAANYTSAPMRLDHNSFLSTSGGAILADFFSCRGLVDHNTFTASDNSEMVHNWGPGTSGWSVDVTPGSTNALYLENNTFYNGNASGTWNAQSAIQSYDAARVVVRYNTFNDSQIDTHGGSNIGTRWFEFYENTFNTTLTAWEQSMDIRAGSGVIYNNHKTGVANSPAIMLRYECRSGDAQYRVGEGINRVHWSPVYIWGNSASLSVDSSSGGCSEQIQSGVNFITSSSQPSSMKLWQTSLGNTTYSYSPFVYPYPLDANGMPNPSGSDTSIVPPRGLRVQ